ncbi:hypothetical protein [Streptomyces sp. NPDC056512]|uniref:hypothetical protein n=1 Tax=Streptomyces sp. NPDC056512 TaxID=3345846 RepID=UPI0036C9078B
MGPAARVGGGRLRRQRRGARVYQRPSAARHHRLRPTSVGSQRGQRDAGGLFDGEAGHLQDWANWYAHSWKAMCEGGAVDMERFLRRLARLEAGLTDCETARSFWRHQAVSLTQPHTVQM